MPMKKWYRENWRFRIDVLSVGADDKPTNCRMGFELGDAFECTYECPSGFCSKSMLKLFPVFEAVRSGGDLTNLGGDGPAEMRVVCPDGVVMFRLTAQAI
jgi:uncharacterized repeat protein (TIGR04076 family)